MSVSDARYLKLLSQAFPTKADVAAQIAQDAGRLALPKPTELFISDIHGEYETFAYILRSGCGALQNHIDAAFGEELTEEEKAALTTLVIYPEQKAALELERTDSEGAWLERAISELLVLLDYLSLTHTHAELQAALPKPYARLVDELRAQDYPVEMVGALIETGEALPFIYALCAAIKQLLVGKLHMVGDVYDRGPAPDLVMDELAACPNIDIQWGNHDIVWMGAALGQRGCIAHVVRNCARYGNLDILSDAYGINLVPLITFAQNAYEDDPCVGYNLKGHPDLTDEEWDLNVKVQKAMAILQFKVEAQLIDENPSFGLEDRKLLHRIDCTTNTIEVDGITYPLTDPVFPTVDWNDPYQLTDEEEEVMRSLEQAFTSCEKLKRHMALLLEKGSLYKIENNVLMFHACVPLNQDGSLKEVTLFDKTYKGKALFDAVDSFVRDAFTATDETARKKGRDLLWYLWLGEGSPLFAKSKMATFEIYLIEDKAARKEVKNPYYSLLDNDEVFDAIFQDFGLDPKTAHIVSGHTPVKVKDGESPIKCAGRVFIIDGGMSSAYQSTTGIAGFTLISDAGGLTLATHHPFAGAKAALENDGQLTSEYQQVQTADGFLTVADTDEDAHLEESIAWLAKLL